MEDGLKPYEGTSIAALHGLQFLAQSSLVTVSLRRLDTRCLPS